MNLKLPLTRKRVGVLVVLASLVCAGMAYATIPDAGTNVYHACMLKSILTIRMIDPSLPATFPQRHCSSLETEITFN